MKHSQQLYNSKRLPLQGFNNKLIFSADSQYTLWWIKVLFEWVSNVSFLPTGYAIFYNPI